LIATSRIKNPTQDVTLTGDLPTETGLNITHSPVIVNHRNSNFFKTFIGPFRAYVGLPNLPEQTIFSATTHISLF
jgi:hypothetical protein